MNVSDAIASLMDDPAEFLSKNALTIVGGSTLSSGLRIWYLTDSGTIKAALSGPGWSGSRTIRHWRAVVTADTSNRSLFTVKKGSDDAAEFRAYYVAMRQIDEGVGTTHFTLPSAGGADFMLTSQLTGCTFGVGSQAGGGGGCLVSHIQPAGSATGRAPGALGDIGKRALLMAVSKPLGPNATILETTGATKISVVGRRNGGIWTFTKQVRDDATGKITTLATTL